MSIFLRQKLWIMLAILVNGFCVQSQTKIFLRPDPQELKKDSTNRKFSLHAEDNQIIDAATEPMIQYLNGNVKIYHEGTFMFCDRAILRNQILMQLVLI